MNNHPNLTKMTAYRPAENLGDWRGMRNAFCLKEDAKHTEAIIRKMISGKLFIMPWYGISRLFRRSICRDIAEMSFVLIPNWLVMVKIIFKVMNCALEKKKHSGL